MRKRTYDRIQIRRYSNYYKNAYGIQPPVSSDYYTNTITIYGSGMRKIAWMGINVENITDHIINHEVLHLVMDDIEEECLDPSILDYDSHWPFYRGLDYMNGEWFATMMDRVGYESPVNPLEIMTEMALY